MTDHGVAAEQLRSFVERVEYIEAEIKDRNSDKKEIYAEAKGNGFDVKVLKQIVRDRAKDPNEKSEFDMIYDLYASKLGMVPANVGAHGEGGE